MGLRVDGTPEGNTHMLNICKARVILVETSEQVHDILQVCVPQPYVLLYETCKANDSV